MLSLKCLEQRSYMVVSIAKSVYFSAALKASNNTLHEVFEAALLVSFRSTNIAPVSRNSTQLQHAHLVSPVHMLEFVMFVGAKMRPALGEGGESEKKQKKKRRKGDVEN